MACVLLRCCSEGGCGCGCVLVTLGQTMAQSPEAEKDLVDGDKMLHSRYNIYENKTKQKVFAIWVNKAKFQNCTCTDCNYIKYRQETWKGELQSLKFSGTGCVVLWCWPAKTR